MTIVGAGAPTEVHVVWNQVGTDQIWPHIHHKAYAFENVAGGTSTVRIDNETCAGLWHNCTTDVDPTVGGTRLCSEAHRPRVAKSPGVADRYYVIFRGKCTADDTANPVVYDEGLYLQAFDIAGAATPNSTIMPTNNLYRIALLSGGSFSDDDGPRYDIEGKGVVWTNDSAGDQVLYWATLDEASISP